MSAMTIVVTLQVICRYLLHSSLPWSEELSRYCMVFVTFLGVSAGLRVGTHTCVDFLPQLLRGKAKFWVLTLGYLATLAFSATFTVVGLQFTLQMISYGQMTAGLHIPTWVPYSIIPIGFAGGTLRCVENLIEHLANRSGRTDDKEVSE